jgi:hypothetical protein
MKMAIETPKFTLLQKDGKFEIRKYEGYISASVEVEADYNHALGEGFGILADYIFGNNRAKTSIAMTAPVTGQAVKNQKIEMTAPVTAKQAGDGKKHEISFTMPAKYTLDNLPEPVNTAISVYKVEPYKAAVLKFSGYMNEKNTVKKIQELQMWLKANKLEAKSGFVSAQYNPPWILGPFRRNEIIAEI